MQDFLTAWMLWYYGNEKYPVDLQNKLTYEEKIEAMKKTEEIKKIVGKSKISPYL